MQLNELTQGQRGRLPPTDSRLRLDIRALEEGRFAQVSADLAARVSCLLTDCAQDDCCCWIW